VISLALGLAVSVCGWLPYYRSDLVEGRFSLFFEAMAALFMPGLLIAGAVGGNFHETSLTFGFIVNLVLYSICLFFALKRWQQRGQTR
jgi:hypothetical protein